MSDSELKVLQDVWEAHAKADPLWAILSEDARRRRGWDLATFLATGESFVANLLDDFERLGHRPHGDVLDFGCGVGRLTQPLARRFDTAIGVDISPTMIAAAQRLNQFGDRVTYVVNDEPTLSFVEPQSLDMVVSFITLQHVPKAAIRSYLAEFLRVLRPGGLLYFQLPSHRNADRAVAVGGEPVTAEASRAAIDVSGVPSALPAGSSATVTVSVVNASSSPWVSLEEHPLRVGNHWTEHGITVVQDDGRSALPATIGPGSACETALSITAPATPGRYGLVVDVVQEGSHWFGDVGSEPRFEISVEVVEPSITVASDRNFDDGPANPGAPFDDLLTPNWSEPPTFEMNGIPRTEIEEFLAGLGATVIDAPEHVDDWVSFGYFVVAGG